MVFFLSNDYMTCSDPALPSLWPLLGLDIDADAVHAFPRSLAHLHVVLDKSVSLVTAAVRASATH